MAGSYTARLVARMFKDIRTRLAASSDLAAIADAVDQEIETIRQVADILSFTPQLAERIEAGDLGISAAWQEA